ncbi:hypothetical protein FJ970_17895 [Mesorhizobium sp. B2-1-8]|uniref:hypothetical protein n=1 Tax=Mesorhizobium sp. B2-1-8 TaxID=2589967 RepID=UPI001D124B92|nr:hypothetical protein [Mesorhizobium sp. B2-1-8]UCI17007.1 hypothetical protein FJ970_17895 [Mesorhizobium sp. B2-1-8]
MSTTKPNVLVATCHDKQPQHAVLHDDALQLMNSWQMARYVSLALCRAQQRLESRIMVNPGIQGLTGDSLQRTKGRAKHILTDPRTYAIAREAEVLAMTETLKLQDNIPEVAASSLAGVIAKLEMIVGADRDIGDPTDFPWPHIASVLRDLKAVAGELPPYRPDRASTRTDAARYWQDACKLVRALADEDARPNQSAL